MTFMTGLQCHLCGAKYPAEALWVCDQCLGPLEVVYDYAGVREALTREVIEKRPQNVWRFRELLPIVGEPRTGFHTGCTPLVRADRLARKLGLRELYIKDDSVNHPTLSYKDRVVSMAATRAVELGFKVFGAPRPATSPTACPPMRRALGSSATCSFRTTSSSGRSSGPPSSGRTSSAFAATTTM